MITPSFIFAMFSLLMIPSVSGNSGQCSAITSEVFSTVSRSTYSASAFPLSFGYESYAITFIPSAFAIRPVA